ncbi:MAG: hypothetical protein CSA58_04080 [Micrococcales bacterium]|nr:MAG: hypothetical protein CSB46_01390 [Micrococcales bacterium]PIE27488.1 MAG: hypothetical protein CSA58_04080 [Micrococcales bacterium]
MTDTDVRRPRPPRSRLTRLVQLSSLALAVLAVWWVLQGVDTDALWASLGRLTAGVVVAVVLLNLAGQVLRATGWWLLLGPAHRLAAGRLIRYEFAAQAATSLTPKGSGEALRLWWLSREGVPATTTTAIIVSRKLISSLGLVPFALLLPLLADLPSWVGWIVAGYAALLLGLAALLLAVLHRRRAGGPPGGGLRRLGGRLLDGLAPLRDARVVLAALALAYATRATDVAAAWLLCASLGLPSGLAAAILALLLVEVSNVLPTVPAQLGSFDAAVATALRALGASDTVSLAYAVLLHVQPLLPQVVAGLVPLLGVGITGRHESPARTESVR